MVVLGIDAHKRTHTAVAVDEHGKRLGAKTVPATSAGNLELVRWAVQFGEHRFAVEDCRHLSRRLERDLLAAGRDPGPGDPEPHGRHAPLSSRARQVRPHRRHVGGPGRGARRGSAYCAPRRARA